VLYIKWTKLGVERLLEVVEWFPWIRDKQEKSKVKDPTLCKKQNRKG